MAKAILIIGRPKTGKTTTVKKILSSLSRVKLIYDVNNEYNTGKELPTLSDFLSEAAESTGVAVVFEEATIYFSNRGDEQTLKNILVRRRHTDNIVILCFHSLRSVPTYVFDLVDFYVLHKTSDNPGLIEKKFAGNNQLLQDIVTVRNAQNPYFQIFRRVL